LLPPLEVGEAFRSRGLIHRYACLLRSIPGFGGMTEKD
jgi:hypothetical protein